MIDPQKEARDKLAVVRAAQDYRELLLSKGWVRLQAIQDDWLLTHLKAMKDAHNSEAALDAWRRWKIAEEFVDLQSAAIHETVKLADEIRGSLQMEEALMMMEHMNEHSASGDPGTADSTGH